MVKCRLCSSARMCSIIPLGEMPLANALLSSKHHTQETVYNLEVMLCQDCGLAQLRDLVAPEDLFSEYVYFSSNADTMLKSVKDLADRIIPSLPSDAFVVEIASNDGYLLRNYVSHGINVLGIDPARNVAEVARERGVPTLCDFFNENLADKLIAEGKKADIIHANNVMAHVPDLNSFIAGIKKLLKQKGQAIIEVPHFLDLVQKLEFDTIYHEHVFYFGLKPLQTAFRNHGLDIFNVDKIDIHGGTLRLFIAHSGIFDIGNIVSCLIAEEEQFGLYEVQTYKVFMKRLFELKEQTHKTLTLIKEKNLKIAGYGASAKGTTLLNFFNIGDYIEFVVDKSAVKQGLYTPGTHLEIKKPEAIYQEGINFALLLAWNFAKEIMDQQKAFIDRGGKFIIPLPEVKITP